MKVKFLGELYTQRGDFFEKFYLVSKEIILQIHFTLNFYLNIIVRSVRIHIFSSVGFFGPYNPISGWFSGGYVGVIASTTKISNKLIKKTSYFYFSVFRRMYISSFEPSKYN